MPLLFHRRRSRPNQWTPPGPNTSPPSPSPGDPVGVPPWRNGGPEPAPPPVGSPIGVPPWRNGGPESAPPISGVPIQAQPLPNGAPIAGANPQQQGALMANFPQALRSDISRLMSMGYSFADAYRMTTMR